MPVPPVLPSQRDRKQAAKPVFTLYFYGSDFSVNFRHIFLWIDKRACALKAAYNADMRPHQTKSRDFLTRSERSERMSQIRSKNTKPELFVRRLLHRMGYRFRLHASDIPGRPDIVFRPRSKVIFVHGCFWHAHACQRRRIPTEGYWALKLATNKKRDLRNRRALARAGWEVLVIWECELRKQEMVEERLRSFLG